VADGQSTNFPNGSAEIYDPVAQTWTVVSTGSATLITRYAFTATAVGTASQEVLLAGGASSNQGKIAEILTIPAGQDTATVATATMINARQYHTATLITSGVNAGQVLLAGGAFGGTFLTATELFNPATSLFTATGSLATGREQHTATLFSGDQVLVTGGVVSGGAALASAELYY
jgi:phage baseplate assembly protein gpV